MSATPGEPAESLWSSFERNARGWSNRAAVIEEANEIDYAALRARAGALAELLTALGATQQPVLLMQRSGIAYIAAVLAATAARAIFAPVEIDWPKPRLDAAARLADPVVVIATPEFEERARALAAALPRRPALVLLAAEGAIRDVEAGPAEPAATPPTGDWRGDSLYLVYTSGSTGTPNAVEGAHRSLAHFIAWQARCYAIPAGVRVTQLAPVTFDVSLRDIFLPLTVGGSLLVPDPATRRNPVRLRRWLVEREAAVMHVVPSVFKVIAEVAEQTGDPIAPTLKHVFFSGERLYARDAERFDKLLPAAAVMANFYGPSESTLIKTHFRLPRPFVADAGAVVPIGTPIDGCEIAIAGAPQLADAPEMRREILLRSDYLAKGYYRDPELTDRRFALARTAAGAPTREYRTGDLGWIDENGLAHFAGRGDDQVKIYGNRVELGDVEHAVRSQSGVADAAVVLAARGDGCSFLGCAWVAAGRTDAAALRCGLEATLPRYMVPALFLELSALPLLFNGKVDRKTLAQRLAEPAPQDRKST